MNDAEVDRVAETFTAGVLHLIKDDALAKDVAAAFRAAARAVITQIRPDPLVVCPAPHPLSCPVCDGQAGWTYPTDYGTGSEGDGCAACYGIGTLAGYVARLGYRLVEVGFGNDPEVTDGPWKVSATVDGTPTIFVDHPTDPGAVNVLFEADWGSDADAQLIVGLRNQVPDPVRVWDATPEERAAADERLRSRALRAGLPSGISPEVHEIVMRALARVEPVDD